MAQVLARAEAQHVVKPPARGRAELGEELRVVLEVGVLSAEPVPDGVGGVVAVVELVLRELCRVGTNP